MTEALDEKYLQYISDTYKIGLLDAAIRMDECIKLTAATHNIDYNIIYNTLFTKENLAKCLVTEKACDQNTVDECMKSCDCFYLEPYGCLPKVLKEAEKINEDPDKYVAENFKDTKSLNRMVEIASYLYYNYDGGGLTDNSYDSLEYHLKKREKIKGRAFEKIGAMPVDKIRVNLIYPIPSLNKIKPGTNECTTFLSRFSPPNNTTCVWSLKLDGVSGTITYKNGNLAFINTRGNGVIGGDITFVKDFIMGVPKTINKTNTWIIKGEFMITKELWDKKYKGSYSNARAFVNGKISSGYISTALNDIEFLAHGIMTIEGVDSLPPPSQSLKILDSQKFITVENGSIQSPTVFEIMELYKRKRLESKYYIDGLVLDVDENRVPILPYAKGGILKNPTDTVAFKMILEEQIRSTKAINVEWNITRYGRYFPVVIYESVYIDGNRLTRASAHNAKHIIDWNMGSGTKIKVYRSGDVIPQIKDVEVDSKVVAILPKLYEDGGYEWHWEKLDIVLDKIETNREVLIKRGVHFFETIGVPKLRQKTIEKMYDFGLKTPENIVRASVTELIKIKGIGKKSAEFFYEKIRITMSETPPDRFIIASTTFKSGLGRKSLKQLFRKLPNILDLSELEIREFFKKTKIPGYGPIKIETLATGIPDFRAYLDSFAKTDIEKSINNYNKNLKYLDEHGRNKLISKQKFVLTGFMGNVDYELEDYIYDHDGDFVSTVTSGVSAVISGNVVDISEKMMKAHELKVPVLSIQEFSERYNVPLKRFENKDENDKDENLF